MLNDSLKTILFDEGKRHGFGDLHFKFDQATGMQAIIAIHSTKLGPALGGCRFIEYTSPGDAVIDAMRLAKGMSYKSAISGLALGGGKAVILKTPDITNREALFCAFGQFVNELGGRYITAVDSGTNVADMDNVYKITPYVASNNLLNGDPSPHTALGVCRAIQAAVKFKLNRNDLSGIHVAIQGLGHVGYYLAKNLFERGATLTVCDKNKENVERAVSEFNAKVVAVDEIYHVACDVFAPCALGAVINENTIAQLRTTIIVGAANNQLAQQQHGQLLHDKGILYGPDYVVNAGGLIYAAARYYKHVHEDFLRKIESLYDTSMTIFERSKIENKPTNVLADILAEERLS